MFGPIVNKKTIQLTSQAVFRAQQLHNANTTAFTHKYTTADRKGHSIS